MTEVQVQHAPHEMRRLDAETALSIARSLHTDLDLSVVLKRLYTFATALTRVAHIRYSNKGPEVSYEMGEEQEHVLTYELKLTSQEDSAGTITMSSRVPLSDHDSEIVAELLSLAANALMNAHKYLSSQHEATGKGKPLTHKEIQKDQQLQNALAENRNESKLSQNKRKYPDALVLVRIEGLDVIRNVSSQELADSIMTELKTQLNENLRQADGTHKVDEDHLAVLLPSTAPVGAERVAEKVAKLVSNLEFVDPLLRRELSVSVGISSTSGAVSAEDVLANAKVQLAKAMQESPQNNTVH
ncbi:MAG: GGDEF domain-containing protein [Pseudomonadota bacterium]